MLSRGLLPPPFLFEAENPLAGKRSIVWLSASGKKQWKSWDVATKIVMVIDRKGNALSVVGGNPLSDWIMV